MLTRVRLQIHAADGERQVDDRAGPFDAGGQSGRVEVRRAHIDAGRGNHAMFAEELERLDARERFDGDVGGAGGDEPFFGGELHDAADAVATHLGLGPVGVEHPHAHVGDGRWEGEDEAITADAEVAVADFAGDFGPVPLFGGQDVDVVVPEAVHLRYAHGSSVAWAPEAAHGTRYQLPGGARNGRTASVISATSCAQVMRGSSRRNHWSW